MKTVKDTNMFLVQFHQPVFLKVEPPSKVFYSHEPYKPNEEPLYKDTNVIFDSVKGLLEQDGIRFTVIETIPIEKFVMLAKAVKKGPHPTNTLSKLFRN